jgi:uncharacterized iron-regulated membrane protein
MQSPQQSKSLKWAKHQKRWFGKWHTYLGIIAGAILAFVGVTGSILVFQDEIDRALNKEMFEVTLQQHRYSLVEIIPIIKRNYPQLKFDYIVAGKTDDPIEAYSVSNFKTEKQTFINPYTGKICGKRIYTSSFIRVVMDLHRTLLVPVVGKYIVGLASLCLIILTISGLRMWLPKKWKQLKAALTVKFNGKFKRKNYDWHNVLGIYSAPVVFMLALTGFCITFSNIIIALLFVFSGKNPASLAKVFGPKSAYTASARPIDLNLLPTITQQQLPGARLVGIGMPADKFGTYRLDILNGNKPVEGQREMVILDQYTGKVLLNSRVHFPNVGEAYLGWLTPIHYGSFGGLPTKILALIGGLIPMALFITGFIIWWPRYKKRKQKEETTANNPVKKEKKPGVKLGLWKTFVTQFKAGFKYASILLPLTFLAGALYGLIAGIMIQPAVFALAFFCMVIALNFVCALLAETVNLLFFTPFKKGNRAVTRYFALSLAFFLVYSVAYMLILNTGLKVF